MNDVYTNGTTDVGGTGLLAVNETLTDRVKQLRLPGKPDGKSRGSSTAWLPWMLCFVMALTWASLGIRWYKNGGFAAPANTADSASADAPAKTDFSRNSAPSAAGTETKPEAAPDAILLSTKGYLIPSHQIAVSPIDVAGRVIDLRIEEGKRFQAGDILAVIDDTSYRAERDESQASRDAAFQRYEEMRNGNRKEEIAQSKHELDEAKAQLKQYELDWKRSLELKNSALASKDYEQAEACYRMQQQKVSKLTKGVELMVEGPRKEKIAQAKAEYEAAEARLKRAEWRLQNCSIKAPVTGVILSKKAEYGSLINPVVGGVSTNLCDMADLSQLEVDLEIQERDISKIAIDMVCKVKADAFPNRTYEGYLDRVMPIANRAKGVLPVRVRVILPKDEAQGAYLKPEMGVAVLFVNKKIDPSIRKQMDEAAAQAEPRPATTSK